MKLKKLLPEGFRLELPVMGLGLLAFAGYKFAHDPSATILFISAAVIAFLCLFTALTDYYWSQDERFAELGNKIGNSEFRVTLFSLAAFTYYLSAPSNTLGKSIMTTEVAVLSITVSLLIIHVVRTIYQVLVFHFNEK